MKRLLAFTVIIFPLFAFADMSDRGRQSDLPGYHHSDLEFLIPLVILIALVAFFGFYWIRDKWKNRSKEFTQELLATLSVFGQGALFLGVIYLAYTGISKYRNSQTTVEQNNVTPIEQNTVVNNQSNENLWASFPPVIKRGSDNTKPNDFLVAAINNPSFNLHDFYVILNMNPQNTQFWTFDRYCRSQYIRDLYTPEQFREVYNSLSAAWNIFQEIQYVDFDNPEIKKYMYEYSQWDTNAPRIEQSSNPQLIRNLKIKPLHYNVPKLGII